MQFLYPALTAGFFLALLPLLIHLINMMRHRRVQWAAMEFLLQSYKKHRKWVWLRQLILLLARMAAVALIVAMLAQLVTQTRYEGLFGNTLTHHYVLLDDSMSMMDRTGGANAFEKALGFVRQLGAEAAKQELHQRYTLIRFSKAAAAGGDADVDANAILQVADLNAEDVDSKFPLRLEEIRTTLEPTELPVGPEAALQVARRLMEQNLDENHILYLVSDFRAKEWDNPREVRELLSDLSKERAQIHLVNCVRTKRPNLAITELKPADETRASGVPLFMNVNVTNYGDETAERVPVKVQTVFYAPDMASGGQTDRPVGKLDESPIIEIESIEPKQTITQRVQVFFPEAGKHVVEAIVPEDSISADNRRWCVVDFPEQETVLVIDGDPNQRNAFYVQAIFEPGQRARTGIRPDVRNSAFLRDTTLEALRRYSAVYLFDIDRLDESGLANLEAYVKEGGGLAFFVGPQVNIAFYNQHFYRDGAGLFPAPLGRDDLLEIDEFSDAPDVEIEATNHPVFHELVQGQNPIVRTVHVERFLRPESGWTPAAGSTVKVLARLRDRSPLAVEKSFGKGRVIAFFSTYAPYWNDLVLGPGVLVALRLQSYLGFAQRATEDRVVASRIDMRFDGDQYRQDIKVFLPTEDPAAPVVVERPAEKQASDARQFVASIPRSETTRSGVYEMWLSRVDGTIQADRFAVNVDSKEGDLAQVSVRELVNRLDPVPVEVGYADQYESRAIEQSGFNQSLLLMGLLLLLLAGEQVLAYFTSFHPSRGTDTSHRGRFGYRASVVRLREANEADTPGDPGPRRHVSSSGDSDVVCAEPPTTDSARGAQR